jgi:AAHS family 4-hydroxybenzoate transporter-like MFS transporter
VLLLGGVLPLLSLPLLALLLPESAGFLVLRRSEQREKVARILRRIAELPADWNGKFITIDAKAKGHSPVRLILRGQLSRGTMLLWTAFFMSLLIIYMMTNWLPILIKDTGLTLSQAALISAMFQIGGTVGAVCLGATMDRFDPWRVLTFAYVVGAGFLWFIGQFCQDFLFLIIGVAGMGFCISGTQVGANALASGFYPTASRATGVAWAHGVGRIGSITGTLGGGALLGMGLSFNDIFSWLMLPAFLAAGAMFFMGRHYRAEAVLRPILPVAPRS